MAVSRSIGPSAGTSPASTEALERPMAGSSLTCVSVLAWSVGRESSTGSGDLRGIRLAVVSGRTGAAPRDVEQPAALVQASRPTVLR